MSEQGEGETALYAVDEMIYRHETAMF